MADEIAGRRQVGDWIDLIRDPASGFGDTLGQICGDNSDLKSEAAQMCLRCLEAFAGRYGPGRPPSCLRQEDRGVAIVRRPAGLILWGPI